MSEEFKGIVDSSYDNGVPFWTYNKDYIFGMVPTNPDGSRWTEFSYTFDDPDEPLVKTERSADYLSNFSLRKYLKVFLFM